MTDSYFTISEHSVGQYKEKGSKFIAHAIQVDSEDSVKEELLKLRKTYFDARHHCYAYVLENRLIDLGQMMTENRVTVLVIQFLAKLDREI